MPSESRYPEHEKLADIRDKSQLIGEFMDWLSLEKKMHFCEEVRMKMISQERASTGDDRGGWGWREVLKPVDVFRPLHIQTLLAEFFDIDQKKIDDEKDQMLEEVRAASARRSGES